MPSSGVDIGQEVIDAYNQIKNAPKKLQWVIFKLNPEGTQILVDSKKDKEGEFNFEEMQQCYKEECFYMVVDFKMQEADGVLLEKLVFIQWVPDTCRIKQKMLYASSAESLKEKLEGLGAKIEAHDLSDITLDAIKQKIQSVRGGR